MTIVPHDIACSGGSLLISEIASAYVRHTPIEIGKWRVVDFLRKRLIRDPVHEIIRVVGGIWMDVETTDYLQREIFVYHDFEPNIRREISRTLKSGDLFIDIGANVGFYALQASNAVGRSGKVYAFEPAPDTRASLLRNIELNGTKNITSVALALSDIQGRAKLYLNKKNNSGAASLNRSPDSGDAVEVELDTYDHFASVEQLSIPA